MDVNSKNVGMKDRKMTVCIALPLLIQTSHAYSMGNSNESPFLEVRW